MSIIRSCPRIVASLAIVVGALVAAPATSSVAVPAPKPSPGAHAPATFSPGKVVAQGGVSAAAVKKASSVSANYYHSCAVTTKGAAICWGYNAYGQLGDGSTTSRSAPVGVSGLSSKVKAVASGQYHSCALKTNGTVWCWGSNGYGELGDNTTVPSNVPVQVYGLSSAKAISAGSFHSCALTTGGKVRCWGFNGYGGLGNGTTTNSAKPVTVSGFSTKGKAVSAADYNTCALTTKGKARCWGYNASGQLGDNTTTNRLTPVTVYGLTKGVKMISNGGNHACAVTSKGAAKCWGFNGYGELGNGSLADSPKPVAVSGLTKKIKTVKAGSFHSCSLSTAGKAKCWGYNGTGGLGDNTTTDSSTPVSVYNLGTGTKISLGYLHTCAVTSAKAVKCWGYNTVGQVGDNTTTDRHAPVKVYGF